ncbi:probable receptor-like serine/threonine-protein kinase At5g57670 isoform X2 [Nymphaea colorata]|uniref:probable receptor-like serine/threonine-protein kinase At5g57670 isoform X2 n=1 Tax=Nymphaea colorata TaxID=210225 RepID=UPI00129D4F9F|nr:probable receptor-like serine/threonine-protein kinase At5g57670 isoform X2 [Nymphaea colorata]
MATFFLCERLKRDRSMASNSSHQGTQPGSSSSPESTCILVGISSNAETAMELLSWTIEVAACPGDTIVALHVLEVKDEQAQQYGTVEKMKMMRRAKAFAMTIVGEFTGIYQPKQVKVQAKVRCSSAIEKGLVDEATSTQAGFLILGRSKKVRQSLAISTHCYLHAPVDCSVVAVLSRLELPGSAPKASSTLDVLPGSAYFEAPKLQKMSSKQPKRDFDTVGQSSDNSFHGSILNRNRMDYKNSDQHNRRSSAQSITAEEPQDGPFGDETFYKRDAHFSAENFVTLGSLLASEPEELKGPADQESQSSRWEYSSSSQFLSPSIFGALEKDGNFSEQLAESERDGLKPTWRCFSYGEIFQATNNFHPGNLVGGGERAEVYKGQIHDGQMVAVKKLANQNADDQKQKEFLIELGIMGHVRHPNITCLIGFCIEGGLYLIFDFSPNGSLEAALHGKSNRPLEWSARYRIALGVARGLHYLHRCCKKRIIHRDIKASNILLGRDFEPQVSDFGLAMWLPEQWSHHSVIPLEGTYGCLAPEYFTNGIVDEKTDVFSYGILLLEIITGRKPVDPSKHNLLFWVKPLMELHNYAALADPKLGSRYDINQMHRLVLAASFCVRESATERPSICEVIQIITGVPASRDGKNWKVSESDDDCYDDETNGYVTDIECQFLRTPYSKIRGYS